MIELQFFDEFYQRIEHVEDAIKDHQEDGFWVDDGDVILENLARRFSTKSEFDEFVRMFPEANKESLQLNVSDTELF